MPLRRPSRRPGASARSTGALALVLFASPGLLGPTRLLAATPADGDLDESFGTAGLATSSVVGLDDSAMGLAVQDDGKILIAGAAGAEPRGIFLARLTPGGSPDAGFGSNGRVVSRDEGNTPEAGTSIALQDDGRIVVAGSRSAGTEGDLLVARFDAKGSPDRSFAGRGETTVDLGDDEVGQAVALQPDGGIVVAGARRQGATSRVGLARLTPDGELDSTFSGDGKLAFDFGGSDDASAVLVQPDGRIVVAGTRRTATGSDVAVARLEADGTLDPTFSGNGKVTIDFGGNETASGLALQADGKIVVVGTRAATSGSDLVVARLRTDGTLDRSFGGNGKRIVDFGGQEAGRGVAVQKDGRVVVVGLRTTGNATDFALARFNGDGSLDTRFSGNGKLTQDFDAGTDRGLAIGLQPGGRVIAAGHRKQGSTSELAVAGFVATPRMPVGALEIPGGGAKLSGIGLASGWACEAGGISIEIDGQYLLETAYRTSRADTRTICGDDDNGYGLLFNWNLIGPGAHSVRALADGVEFAHSSFSVTTLGDTFLRGASGQFELPGFPRAGATSRITWQESRQNFVITGVTGAGFPAGALPADPAGEALALPEDTAAALAAPLATTAAASFGALEIPGPGSTQSGIGLVSGWACGAAGVTLEIDGTLLIPAAYGTSREDTLGVCDTAATGFGLLLNWALLGAGPHTIRALDGASVLGQTSFSVVTLGDTFLRGLTYSRRLADFPEAGSSVDVEWVDAQQGFVIVGHQP